MIFFSLLFGSLAYITVFVAVSTATIFLIRTFIAVYYQNQPFSIAVLSESFVQGLAIGWTCLIVFIFCGVFYSLILVVFFFIDLCLVVIGIAGRRGFFAHFINGPLEDFVGEPVLIAPFELCMIPAIIAGVILLISSAHNTQK